MGSAGGRSLRRAHSRRGTASGLKHLVFGVLQRVETKAPNIIPVDNDKQDHKQRSHDESHSETTPCSHVYSAARAVIGE